MVMEIEEEKQKWINEALNTYFVGIIFLTAMIFIGSFLPVIRTNESEYSILSFVKAYSSNVSLGLSDSLQWCLLTLFLIAISYFVYAFTHSNVNIPIATLICAINLGACGNIVQSLCSVEKTSSLTFWGGIIIIIAVIQAFYQWAFVQRVVLAIWLSD